MSEQTPEQQLAELQSGEEPYDDDRLVASPPQWIWLWNRATPAERLERAQQAIDDAEQARHLDFLRSGDGGPAEPGAPLCTAYWDAPDDGRVHCWRGAGHEVGYFHAGETMDGVRYQWRDGTDGAVPHRAPDPAAPIDTAHRNCIRCGGQVQPGHTCDPAGLRRVNAHARLRLAREALIEDGYFTADEVGEDIAPRIVEWLTHHRDRPDRLAAVLGEVLAVFRAVTDDSTRTLVGYMSAPIHPTDMDRWRAVLHPKEQ